MNRFEYVNARLNENESFVAKDNNIKLYDGDEKTQFEEGELVLTTHRLFWGRAGEIAQAARTLCLSLQLIITISEEIASSYIFGRKTRLILHLRPPASNKLPGPCDSSRHSFIKLSGKHGISTEFANALRETLNARIWEINTPAAAAATTTAVSNNNNKSSSTSSSGGRRLVSRTGIGGIERVIEEKTRETNDNITLAFQDLSVLMAMAKDMIAISNVISTKIRDHHGDISEDETVRFKSYLMSLGISDPVTRDHFNSNTEYFRTLAEQISAMLLDVIEECGGMMSLADVYCRVNRARGYELLSPEDLLHACEQLKGGALTLRKFPSGAMVLQLASHHDEQIAEQTLSIIQEAESMAVEELAQQLSISLLLAKERLLCAERLGKLCRDDSISGLRFYPNYFLLPHPAAG